MNYKYATIGLISGYLAGYLQDYFTDHHQSISQQPFIFNTTNQTTRI